MGVPSETERKEKSRRLAKEPFSELPDDEVEALLGRVSSDFPKHTDYNAEQFEKAADQARIAKICQLLRAQDQSWRQIQKTLRASEPRAYSHVYLRSLVQKLDNGDGVWSFVSQKYKCGRPRRLTSRELLEVVWLWTQNSWKTRSKFYKELRVRWKLRGKRNKDLPTYDTINSLVNSIRPDVLDFFEGRLKHYHDKYTITAARYYPHVYHTWQLDEHRVKLIAKDPKTGRRFRPYLIGALDCLSRMIVGAELLDTKSTIKRNLNLIYEAARPKNDPDDIIQGLPENIQVDNEAFFDNRSLHYSLGYLGVVPIHIYKNCPQENGRIERFFRMIENEFFAGFYSFIRRKCSRHCLFRDAIPFDLLQKLFREWLHYYNYERIHTAHGRAPIEVYREQRKNIAKFEVTDEELRPKFCLVSPGTVHPSGIIQGGFKYQGPALAGLVGQKVHVLTPFLYDEPPSIAVKLGDTDKPRVVPRYRAPDTALGEVIRAAGRARLRTLNETKNTLKRYSTPLPQWHSSFTRKTPLPSRQKLRTTTAKVAKPAPPPAEFPRFTSASPAARSATSSEL